MKKNENHVDIRFRLFLLNRLFQSLTFNDIKRATEIDSGKKISSRRLRYIISNMRNNHLIKKTPVEEKDVEGSLYMYIITKKGIKKLKYYKKKLNQ